jgi:predicted O-linked N-acetylglucosamine transferase (SPINDLY family)
MGMKNGCRSMLQQALDLHRKGRLAEAASLYREILSRTPSEPEVLHLLGVVELQRKNSAAAIENIARALALNPANAGYLVNYGIALRQSERFDEALASFDSALAIQPGLIEAHIAKGNVLRNLRRFPDALAAYDRALVVKPDYAEVLYNRGLALRDLIRFEEALVSYDRALAIRPDYADALHSRGLVLRDLMRFQDALTSYDRVLALQPARTEAFVDRGNLLRDLMRFEEALISYEQALALRPDYPELLVNRGNVLGDLGRLHDALASYERALGINPDYAGAWINRGNALRDLKRFDDALASFDRAAAIEPNYPFLAGHRLFFKLSVCDWRGLPDEFAMLEDKIRARQKAAMPFHVVATPLSAAMQRMCSEIYHPGGQSEKAHRPGAARYENGRIRLGYFSTDFHNHAVAHVIAELFELHDRTKFELIAFSFGPPVRDAKRIRLEKSFDRFIEAGALSDKDVAGLARSLEIDIAIDLNGFTQGSRTGVFAMGAAPVQVSYLGYPGTMGAEYIDYLIADSTLIPEDQQQHYSEKIVYLPDSYQVNDSKLAIADKQIAKAECGLPENAFVFCCFNNNFKIAPDMFDVWMRLLKNVDGSVLWLLEDNEAAAKNLRAQAQARGIAPERLVFAKRLELSEYLTRHRLADLVLDTLPYNGHATGSAALWAGVPVVTCLGKTFPGRVGASLLKAIGLPELIASDLAEYETIARELAANPQKLLALRHTVAANRLTHPLFDTARFTKHLESAYVAMCKRHRHGLAPDHIIVEPLSSQPSSLATAQASI